MAVVGVIGALIVALVVGAAAAVVLSGRRFVRRLQAHSTFSRSPAAAPFRAVTYAGEDDARLRDLRDRYPLAEISGSGSDAARAMALMRWVHSLAHHTPNPPKPERLDALHLIRLCTEEKRRLNCWLFATILNDVYLAVGLASRIVHLSPPPGAPRESHVVTAVYLRDVGRWVLMGPDMRAFAVDEQGVPIGFAEVRERLAGGLPLRINDDIHMSYGTWLPRRLRKAVYRWYLSKSCFRYDCPVRSEPNYESRESGRTYVQVIPDGYHAEWLVTPRRTARGNTVISTGDVAGFWVPPQ